MKFRSIIELVKATAIELAAAFTGSAQMGYQTDGTEGFYGRVGASIKRFLMEGDIVATAPASETQTGVVQIATNAEFLAGTDDDGVGSALVPKPSQVKLALDTKIQGGGDIDASVITAPRVISATDNGGLLIKDIAATQQARLKATGAAELSVRTAADDAYADLHTDDLIVHGNLTVQGTQTIVNSTNMSVTDNEIILNKDETGAGVTAGTAGIRIERGTAADALLQFNETLSAFQAGIDGLNVVPLARKYSGVLGASATSHVITHDLNTKDIKVSVYDGDEEVFCGVATSTVNAVTLTFAIAVTGYRVVVIG
jgi:hypothetical protein